MSPYFLFIILVMTMGLFIWGRWRFDVVAFFALMVSVAVGVVPAHRAFEGLGNPAVITVACVMVITRAIMQSGLIDLMVRKITPITKHLVLHILVLSTISAVLSAFMNNVGALALMMPVAIRSAINNDRSPSLLLMPIAFASVLGGLVTAIGTPPNLLISAYRQKAIGYDFTMFDFAPVGLTLVVVGVAYLAFLGWRLIPKDRKSTKRPEDLFKIKDYITEIKIPQGALVIGKTIQIFEQESEADFLVLGMIRNKRKNLAVPSGEFLKRGDVLIIKASPEDLQRLLQTEKVELVADKILPADLLHSEDVLLVEAVVKPYSRVEGRSVKNIPLRSRFGVNLLAVSRQGRAFKQRLKEVKLKVGDVLLLQGNETNVQDAVVTFGLLPLMDRGIDVKAKVNVIPLSIFALGIILVVTRVLPVQIAFSMVVLVMILAKNISIRHVYESIDWSVIILLAAMIPIGYAMQSTGGADMLAGAIAILALHVPPWVVLGLLLVLTMTLSDVMNNAATAVVMAPIALGIAQIMHANVDTFLMTVAIGASSSFLTPIGHQNNLLVMGLGGYKFFDYFRVGFPLEIIILLVGLPTLMMVWPI